MDIPTVAWQDYPSGDDHTVVGTLKQSAAEVRGPGVQPRPLLVWLPPSYGQSARRYPVLYMQDGQNLFDAATSHSGEWQVDETMTALSVEGIEAIIVGVPNVGATRGSEYSPHKHRRFGGGTADAYIRYLAGTVKPLIDRDFRTVPARTHTGLAGSSLGGLVSLYGLLVAPATFGFAGVFSPAFWWTQGTIWSLVERAPFVPGRIYMDVGTHETPSIRGRATAYLNDAVRMAALLRTKGYGPDDLWFVIDEGGLHHESAWARRLPAALRWLLGPLTSEQ